MEVELLVMVLEHGRGLEVPGYQSAGAVGLDLRAAIRDSILLRPGCRQLVPCGLVVAIPPGFEGQVRPRSGLAKEYGVTILNSPGTIDQDYRGEVGVLLINMGSEPYEIARGNRIAQLVVSPIARVAVAEGALEETSRGIGGFGSTGLR